MPSASRDAYVRKSGPLAGKTVYRGYAYPPGAGRPETDGPYRKRSDALKWAIEREAEMVKEAAERASAASTTPTVAEWWQSVQDRQLWPPLTELARAQRDRDLRLYALRRYGETALDKLDPGDITDWLARLVRNPQPEDRSAGDVRLPTPPEPGKKQRNDYADPARPRPLKPISVATVRRAHASFRALVQLAVERGVVPHNPAAAARLPRTPPVEEPVRALRMDDALKAAKAMPDLLVTPAVIAALTGLRLGELRALDETSWQPGEDRIRVNRVIIEPTAGSFAWRPFTKAGKRRTVPLIPEARHYLEQHAERHGPRQVVLRRAVDDGIAGPGASPRLWFTDADGQPLRRRNVGAAWARAQVKAELASPIPWHGLRHTYATALLTAGEEIARIAVLLGHSVTRTTEIYAHFFDTDHESARIRLSAAAQSLVSDEWLAAWRAEQRQEMERDIAAWEQTLGDGPGPAANDEDDEGPDDDFEDPFS